MKAVQLQNSFGLESLIVTEQPEPKPGPGQVLVKMRDWSLNYHDLLVIKGLYNPKLKLPFVPLSDSAGEVDARGEGVADDLIGRRVAGAFLPKWIAGEPSEAKSKVAL